MFVIIAEIIISTFTLWSTTFHDQNLCVSMSDKIDVKQLT